MKIDILSLFLLILAQCTEGVFALDRENERRESVTEMRIKNNVKIF